MKKDCRNCYETCYNCTQEGNYNNGEKNGYGKEYNLSGLVFEVNYLNYKKNGLGIYTKKSVLANSLGD